MRKGGLHLRSPPRDIVLHISAATGGCIQAAARHKSPRTTCSQAVLGLRQLTRSAPAEQAATERLSSRDRSIAASLSSSLHNRRLLACLSSVLARHVQKGGLSSGQRRLLAGLDVGDAAQIRIIKETASHAFFHLSLLFFFFC